MFAAFGGGFQSGGVGLLESCERDTIKICDLALLDILFQSNIFFQFGDEFIRSNVLETNLSSNPTDFTSEHAENSTKLVLIRYFERGKRLQDESEPIDEQVIFLSDGTFFGLEEVRDDQNALG